MCYYTPIFHVYVYILCIYGIHEKFIVVGCVRTELTAYLGDV